jgi:hypothetical protein
MTGYVTVTGSKTPFDWLCAVFTVTLIGGIGTLLIGSRSKFTVMVPELRLIGTTTLFTIPLKRKSWDFADFSRVEVRLVPGPRGSYAPCTFLCPKGDSPSVQTHYYAAYAQISDQQLADARRLAETMGLPLVVPAASPHADGLP